MKVMYLTWGETPRSYGVFGSQVIGQFVETIRQNPTVKAMFVSGVPLVHSGLVREKHRYFDELRKIKELLHPVPFKWVPIFATQNIVEASKNTFNWMYWGAWNNLRSAIEKFEPDIVHCRSYHATWAALQIKKQRGWKYKIVFDARGIYPEEVALKRDYQDDGENYKFLKNIEEILLIESDVTVAVSDTMAEYFKEKDANVVETIYLSASYSKLKVDMVAVKPYSRPLEFCYVGALSENTWHKTSELEKLFATMKKHFRNARLTIVSTSNHNLIRNFFKAWRSEDVVITSTRNVDELKLILKNSDFGMMSYFEPITPREIVLANMVMGVKVAEYLCAGVPVIVNSYCGGAASLIEKHNLGVVYNPKKPNSIDIQKVNDFVHEVDARNRIRSVAKEIFDYEVHARQYMNIYERIMN